MVNSLPATQETWIQSLDWEDRLEKGMATHSSILTGRIPWTEEPGRLQSMGSQKAGHDWAANTFTFSLQEVWPKPTILHCMGAPHALVTANTGAPWGGQAWGLCPRRAGDTGCSLRDRAWLYLTGSLRFEPNLQFPNTAAFLWSLCLSVLSVGERGAEPVLHVASLSPSGITFVTIHCQNGWRPLSQLY